jgi:hypothetical protein
MSLSSCMNFGFHGEWGFRSVRVSVGILPLACGPVLTTVLASPCTHHVILRYLFSLAYNRFQIQVGISVDLRLSQYNRCHVTCLVIVEYGIEAKPVPVEEIFVS